MTPFNNIAIIGGGNLGSSIAKGILSLDNFKKDNIIICEKRILRVKYLKDQGFNVIDSDIKKTVVNANIIIVSVKPQQFIKLLEEIKPHIKQGQILVSTVTGISLAEIENVIGKHPTVRIMPNTAIEIRESMTCICFNNTGKDQQAQIIELFNQLGQTVLLQEELLDAVTVLGACGIVTLSISASG